MDVAVAWGGPIAVALAWVVVRSRRATVWTVMGVAYAVLAALSIATGEVRAFDGVAPWLAVSGGLGAGVALFAATVAVTIRGSRRPVFRRQVADLYSSGRGLALPAALLLAVLVVVPGEEMVFRGVVQGVAADGSGGLGGAALAWGAYVAANAASGSLPVILGAVGPGAVWGLLAFWSGGVVAGAACHAVWTGLMIARPPRVRRP